MRYFKWLAVAVAALFAASACGYSGSSSSEVFTANVDLRVDGKGRLAVIYVEKDRTGIHPECVRQVSLVELGDRNFPSFEPRSYEGAAVERGTDGRGHTFFRIKVKNDVVVDVKFTNSPSVPEIKNNLIRFEGSANILNAGGLGGVCLGSNALRTEDIDVSTN